MISIGVIIISVTKNIYFLDVPVGVVSSKYSTDFLKVTILYPNCFNPLLHVLQIPLDTFTSLLSQIQQVPNTSLSE